MKIQRPFVSNCAGVFSSYLLFYSSEDDRVDVAKALSSFSTPISILGKHYNNIIKFKIT